MRKNIELMTSFQENNNQIKNSKKLICPQDIKPFYQAALAKGTKFIDSLFPPQLSTIGDVAKFKFGW